MYSEFLESKKVEPFWSRFFAVLGSGKKPFLSGPNVVAYSPCALSHHTVHHIKNKNAYFPRELCGDNIVTTPSTKPRNDIFTTSKCQSFGKRSVLF